MKRLHRVSPYLLAAACSIVFFASPADAQLENIDPGLAYLDNIGRIGMGGGGGGMGVLSLPSAAPEEEPFWHFKGYSLGYFYSRRDSQDDDDVETNLHTVVPELFMYTKKLFSLDASMAYTRADSTDAFSGDGDGNVFDATIIPAQEVLSLLTGKPPTTTLLHLGVLLGYRHLDNELQYPTSTIRGNTDTFSIGPNAILKHTVFVKDSYQPRWDFYLVPAYVFQVGTGNFSGTDSFDLSSGSVAVLGRTDFWASKNVAIVTTAQWRRDIQQALGPLPESHENWADFGTSLRLRITDAVGVRFGYRYTAFHSDYEGHSIDFRIEMPPFPI